MTFNGGGKMLVPAVVYKDEIKKRFIERMYSDDMFYYQGYPYGHETTEIEPQDNLYQWAIVGQITEVGNTIVPDVGNNGYKFIPHKYHYGQKLIGYFSYRINPTTDNVYNFGLYSFDKGNALVAHDVFKKMEELIKEHHRVEWRCVGGNKAMDGYVKFCKRMLKKHSNLYVQRVRLTDVTKDNHGNYHDEHLFEIVNFKKTGGMNYEK